MFRNARFARVMLMTARGLLVLITVVWGGFAVLSGVGAIASGGVVWWQNLPNAAPWVGLAGLVWATFRWPRIGGGLVVLFGAASVLFFDAWTSPVVFFGASLPLMVAGFLSLLGGVLSARNQRETLQ